MFERFSDPYKFYLPKVWMATYYKNEWSVLDTESTQKKALIPNDNKSTQKKF